MYHVLNPPNIWKFSTVLQHRANVATLFVIVWWYKNRDRLTFKSIPSFFAYLVLFITWRITGVHTITICIALIIVKDAVTTLHLVLILILCHSLPFSLIAVVTLVVDQTDTFHNSSHIRFPSYTLPLSIDIKCTPSVEILA